MVRARGFWDLDPAPTQGQVASLLAVPISLPLRAVLAPRAHQLSQLLLEDFADRRQPEPDRECQQPLSCRLGQRCERNRDSVWERDRGPFLGYVDDTRARYGCLRGGSSLV